MFFQSPSFILIFAFIANGLAYSFFVITLPNIGRTLQFSDTNTGVILGISALVITLVSPVWGSICERYGRRNVIIFGMLSTTLFTLITALVIEARVASLLSVSGSYLLLLSTRLVNSVFTGGLKPSGQAYIADTTTDKDRAAGMGFLGGAFGVGSIVGGLLAMLCGSESLISGYIFISGVLMVSTCLVIFLLPETPYLQDARQSISKVSIPYAQIWTFLLITLIGLTIFSLLQHVVGLTLQDKLMLTTDQSVRRSGMIMMVTMVIMIGTQFLIVRKLSLSAKEFIVAGATVAMFAMASASAAGNLLALTLSMGLFGLGLGLLLPGNLASLSLAVGKQNQAKVAGVNGIGQGIGLALGPVLGVFLHKLAYFAPYLFCAVLLLGLLGYIFCVNKKEYFGFMVRPQNLLRSS